MVYFELHLYGILLEAFTLFTFFYVCKQTGFISMTDLSETHKRYEVNKPYSIRTLIKINASRWN